MVGVHPVAYEMDLLPGRIAQHSARVTFIAYKPLHRSVGSVFSQHDPRTSLTVVMSVVPAVDVTVSPTTRTEQIATDICCTILKKIISYTQSYLSVTIVSGVL